MPCCGSSAAAEQQPPAQAKPPLAVVNNHRRTPPPRSGLLGDSELYLKILVLGESGVGKTNLVTRFVSNEFRTDTASTLGVDFLSKHVEVEGLKIKAQLWDTAGQERFKAIIKSLYRGTHGVLIVYDITSRESFEAMTALIKEVRSLVGPSAPMLLAGNKCDLEHMRQVKKEQAEALARDNGISFFETSALDSTNVQKAFEFLLLASANSFHDNNQPDVQYAVK